MKIELVYYSDLEEFCIDKEGYELSTLKLDNSGKGEDHICSTDSELSINEWNYIGEIFNQLQVLSDKYFILINEAYEDYDVDGILDEISKIKFTNFELKVLKYNKDKLVKEW